MSESLEGGKNPAGRGRTWATGLTVAGFLALVLIPLLVRQIPREVSQWYVAAALRDHDDGRPAAARLWIEAALRWNPANVDALLSQARWRGEERDYDGALSSLNRAADMRSDDVRIYYERSQVLQHLHRGLEAVADWQKIAELNQPRERMASEQIWNGLAYARAVANVELDTALDDAQRAVERRPESPELLDTRGYILYRLGRHADALRDLNAAVDRTKKDFDAVGQRPNLGRDSAVDPQRRDKFVKELAQGLAVMYYHRSLAHHALGDEAAADEDRRHVTDLGFSPDDDLF